MYRALLALALLASPGFAQVWDGDLTALGIVLQPAQVAPGQRYW